LSPPAARRCATTKIVETDHAAALMAVLEEIVAGSHGLVSDWALLTHARAALEQ
jgi:hypothetical protein